MPEEKFEEEEEEISGEEICEGCGLPLDECICAEELEEEEGW
jgi:hypothetical protein